MSDHSIRISVNGQNIDQTHSLTSLLDQHQPGDKVTLTVLRGSQTLHIDGGTAASDSASAD